MSEYSILVEKEKMRSMLKEKLDELYQDELTNTLDFRYSKPYNSS